MKTILQGVITKFQFYNAINSHVEWMLCRRAVNKSQKDSSDN